ncbi:MAG: c-type cytochrome, partial [Gemmataceae bacterium]
DAYPPEFREKLYMGNIHGGCINSDKLTRSGSSYLGKIRPDFLTANDQWFMPVVQKVGPDGCLYVLDWYDRYHCYQDANRDPEGIDRLNGRLYRVRYQGTPRAGKFDLASESDDQLLQRLQSPNVFYRDIAQRVLTERASPELRAKLESFVLDDSIARKGRLHGLWALIGGQPLASAFHQKLLAHPDPTFRAFGVRAAGNMGKVDDAIREKVASLAKDSSGDVQVQVAIASRKIEGMAAISLLLDVLANAGNDSVIPHIVWQNFHPLIETQPGEFLEAVTRHRENPNIQKLVPRVIDRILSSRNPHPTAIARLYEMSLKSGEQSSVVSRQILTALATRIRNGEIDGVTRDQLKDSLWKNVEKKDEREAVLLGALLNDSGCQEKLREWVVGGKGKPDESAQLQNLETLIVAQPSSIAGMVRRLLDDPEMRLPSVQGRGQFLAMLSRLDDDTIADTVLTAYASFEPELKPRAIELLTQRATWGKKLLRAMGEKKVPSGVLNVNQARRLLASQDAELSKLVAKHYGTIRMDRNPGRENLVREMGQMLRRTQGDPQRGAEIYKKLCAQCHKIHGEGVEVGPDITLNGRSSFDQLLSNVFDPSLVIGPSYQAVTVETTKGRSLTGLLAEDNTLRVVLKVQGGKQEVIPRSEIESMQVSKLSLMPEDVEKQLKAQEIADLFAFLVFDRPPTDPAARRIPGTPPGLLGEK